MLLGIIRAVSIWIAISPITLNQIRNASNRKPTLLKIGYPRFSSFWVVHFTVVRWSQAIHTITHQILVSINFKSNSIRPNSIDGESPIYFCEIPIWEVFILCAHIILTHSWNAKPERRKCTVYFILFVLIDRFALEMVMEVENLFLPWLEWTR